MNRLLNAALVVALSALSVSSACTADEEEKSGYDGEFCSKDDDCRANHVCERGACVERATPQRVECQALCNKLNAECMRNESQCEARCVQTLAGWSAPALEAFGQCTLNELTCEQAADGTAAATFCYRRIPLDTARQARCDLFVTTAEFFGAASNAASIERLFDRCYRLARTGTEENWSRTQVCQDLINDGTQREVADCLSAVFVLDPKLVVSAMMPEPTNDAP
jgi:hypothetical protein